MKYGLLAATVLFVSAVCFSNAEDQVRSATLKGSDKFSTPNKTTTSGQFQGWVQAFMGTQKSDERTAITTKDPGSTGNTPEAKIEDELLGGFSKANMSWKFDGTLGGRDLPTTVTVSGESAVEVGQKNGRAVYRWEDPFTFSKADSPILTLAWGFDSDFAFLQSGGGTGIFHTDAGTTIPGLERLFDLTVNFDAAGVTVDFVSNPGLGLRDSDFESMIKAGFVTTSTGSAVAGPFNYLSLDLKIPDNVDLVSLNFNGFGETNLPAIPEPSTVFGGVFLVVIAGFYRSRRRIGRVK